MRKAVLTITSDASVGDTFINQTEVTTVVVAYADGDPLTYSLTGGADQALFAIDPSTGVLTFNDVPDYANPTDAGKNNQYIVVVTVRDGSASDSQTITVTVLQLGTGVTVTIGTTLSYNDPPTANAGADQSVAEGDAVKLDGSGSSDPNESDTLTYAWTQIDIDGNAVPGNAAVTLNEADTASPTFTAPATAATLIFSLTVNDARPPNAFEDSQTATVTITVTVADINDAPTDGAFITTWRTTEANETITIPTTGDDGQGLSFSFSPGYGDTGGGLENVWRHGLRDDAANDRGADRDYALRFDTRLGYGLTAPAWLGGQGFSRSLLTPYAEMTLSGERRSHRLGLRWALGSRFDLDLVGERRESDDDAEHAILLKGEARF